jgi:hypothetical protein
VELVIPVCAAHALAAKPLLLIYPRMYVRQLFVSLGGSAAAFAPLKFQYKTDYFRGK